MQKIVLPQLAWYGPKELVLDLPDSWDVEICNIAGYNRPALSADQIRDAIARPIDRPPLRELAKGKKDVVIIFDDLTRGTRSADIIPHILEELAQAGIEDNNIKLICGLGAHAPLSRIDLAKKVGEDVIARYTVYNHNAFDNCAYVGTTSYGNKVHINSEVVDCDLKITIGSMAPHPFAVFSGAGKIILPAVSSIETILFNHTMPLTDEMRANWDINVRRLDMEEASAFAKVDVLVDCIMNMWGETVSLYAGAPVSVREAAIVEARKHYLARRTEDKDIVITNAYTKASEGAVVLRTSFGSVSKRGGDLVLVANAPGGQVSHYLIGSWGHCDDGECRKLRLPIPDLELPAHIKHLIRYNEYPEISSMRRFKPKDKVAAMSNWGDVLELLEKSHRDGAKVVVYPSADIQNFGS